MPLIIFLAIVHEKRVKRALIWVHIQFLEDILEQEVVVESFRFIFIFNRFKQVFQEGDKARLSVCELNDTSSVIDVFQEVFFILLHHLDPHLLFSLQSSLILIYLYVLRFDMTLLVRVLAMLVFFIAHFLKSYLVAFNLLLVKGQRIFVGFFNFTNFFFELWLSLWVLRVRAPVVIQVVNIFKEVL